MKIILIMVSSLDGVIARDQNQNSFDWTSPEDKDHFISLTKKIGVFIMGGTTFKASRRKSYPGRIGYVLTSSPKKYEAGEDIHFISGTPFEIKKEIEGKDVDQVALCGGASVNQQFLKAGLVDEIYLTIEPVILGQGMHIADFEKLNIKLRLLDTEKLNDKGTIVIHYKVLN